MAEGWEECKSGVERETGLDQSPWMHAWLCHMKPTIKHLNTKGGGDLVPLN